MSVCFILPYTPLLYSKTGVYRGLHYFLILALKHILWVLVRAASLRNRLIEAVLTCTHNICFEQKYENIQNSSTESCHFYRHEKSLYIACACFRNDLRRVARYPVFGFCLSL